MRATIALAVLVAVCHGCQSSTVQTRDGPDGQPKRIIFAYQDTSASAAEATRKYHLGREPQPQPPQQWDQNHTKWHPNGAPDKFHRTYRVQHLRPDQPAQRPRWYTATAKSWQNYHSPAATQPIQPPAVAPEVIPDIVIYSGWIYASGVAPAVATSAVTLQADGCTLLLYYYQDQAGNRMEYCRVCYLEGDPNQIVWMYPNAVAPDPPKPEHAYLTVGTYADILLDPQNNNAFKQWKGGAMTPDVRYVSELANDAVHTAIMEEVYEALNEPAG